MGRAPLHPALVETTARITDRSRALRADYLARMSEAAGRGRSRERLSCANLAHAFAAAPTADKARLLAGPGLNLAIVTSYNDMLSAHQPFADYPQRIKEAARELSATAQVAGGVPAMCDGVTQGQAGMELSLFSREVIALSTAVALSHDAFDAALLLGVCDKIVPGLVIGALSFAHLPILLAPAGPMTSGLANSEKARVRQAFAAGTVGREALLASEAAAYHGPGTCTFYGTANSNQMLMEVMGLHLPGAAFIPPGTELRDALTREAARQALRLAQGPGGRLHQVVSEKAVVNAIVGLMATGGSTNHTLHLVAMARAAGVLVDWEDFDRLSLATPLLARIYPNGGADVNHFHAAGGMAFLMRELLDAGLLHEDVETVRGAGLRAYAQEPWLDGGALAWREPPAQSLDREVLRPHSDPFASEGGLRLLKGNLGRGVIKVSAVAASRRRVRAPALVFHDQEAFSQAFQAGALERDFIAVLRFQGPKANGMPELHNLTPPLSLLQDRGWSVALVTDGRMSGASGKVPAAIHVTPEAAGGGPISRIRDGDLILLDADRGVLDCEHPDFDRRATTAFSPPASGCGRELFQVFRDRVGAAETGAGVFFQDLAQ